MTNPSVLILDEPLEGLAPVIIAEVSGCLRRLVAEEGTTLILVEQRAAFALEMTSQAIVLERGRWYMPPRRRRWRAMRNCSIG